MPVVLLRSALTPLAVLLLPVVLAFKAPEPSAVLDAIAPAPFPTRTPDRVASVVEVTVPVTARPVEETVVIAVLAEKTRAKAPATLPMDIST